MYCINIDFDLNFKNEIQKARPSHLLYIETKKEFISFGGVLENEESVSLGILYIVRFSTYNEAFSFLSEDPYFKYVKKYQINKFSLKINNNG